MSKTNSKSLEERFAELRKLEQQVLDINGEILKDIDGKDPEETVKILEKYSDENREMYDTRNALKKALTAEIGFKLHYDPDSNL